MPTKILKSRNQRFSYPIVRAFYIHVLLRFCFMISVKYPTRKQFVATFIHIILDIHLCSLIWRSNLNFTSAHLDFYIVLSAVWNLTLHKWLFTFKEQTEHSSRFKSTGDFSKFFTLWGYEKQN